MTQYEAEQGEQRESAYCQQQRSGSLNMTIASYAWWHSAVAYNLFLPINKKEC